MLIYSGGHRQMKKNKIPRSKRVLPHASACLMRRVQPMTTFPLLLEPTLLARHLDEPGLLIVDLGKEGIYRQAHVPGAIHVDYRRLQQGTLPAPGLLPAPADITALLSDIGLTPERQIVAYDDEGGGRAARFLWLLEIAGHPHASFLNGGIHAWLAEDLPVETHPSLPTPSDYVLGNLNLQPLVSLDELLSRFRLTDVVIWDARSREEFDGSRMLAQRAGHIPGAVHYEWTTAMDKDRDLRLRDLGEIRGELAALGIVDGKEIITHCQTHYRSSFTWLLGRILGFRNIRGYAGAWSEWGNHPDTPVVQTLS